MGYKYRRGTYYLAMLWNCYYVQPIRGRIYEVDGIKMGISRDNGYRVVDFSSGVLAGEYRNYKHFEDNINEVVEIIKDFKKNRYDDRAKMFEKLIKEELEKEAK